MAVRKQPKSSVWEKQIQNRNFLSPVGFKFNLQKAPKVDFFSNSTGIPGIDLGVAIQSTYLKNIPVPGDKLEYRDFSIQFMIDENLENYLEIHNWMRGLGYPESVQEHLNLTEDSLLDQFSDGTLIIYNSNFREVAKITFQDMFPVSLTPVEFDAKETDINYIMAEATFKYTIFNVETLVYES